jgi:hypothetical protein
MRRVGISRDSLEGYFRGLFKRPRLRGFRALGRGVHGTGFLVTLDTEEGEKTYVLKDIAPGGLGHDYPSDRAAVLLLALDTYGRLPRHVNAVEVLSLQGDGTLRAVGGGKDYFLLMEKAEGTSYFKDLGELSGKSRLEKADREKIRVMAAYLKRIHARKKKSRTLYLRRLRDIIGHGECLMGVFDAYPGGVLSYRDMAGIEKMCIDWRARLKEKHTRLSQVHGDFHPGNIWFTGGPPAPNRLCLLDRSRGPWGEPADDLTALTINYVFFSVRHFNALAGPYDEALRLFFTEYIGMTGDREVLEVLAPFYAFRGAVVANPAFYPELTLRQRKLIFRFVRRVLETRRFAPERANEYI